MTHREQLLILALLIVLAILAWFFWPAPTFVPVSTFRVAPSASGVSALQADVATDGRSLGATRSAEPLSGQATPGAPFQPRTCERALDVLGPDGPHPAKLGASDVDGSRSCQSTPSPAATAPATVSPSASPPSPAATPVRVPTVAVTGHSIRGTATWYRYVVGGAAAGRRLRAALGPGWRGRSVTVCAAVCVRVRLSDWMAADHLVDLDSRSFSRLAPLSRGIVEVEVSW